MTDITEHATREGKVFCAVVLDAFSRGVVGWFIDSRPTASLVTNALGMAIDNRNPAAGETVIHSDQDTQFTSWAFTQRAVDSGLLPSMGSVGDCLLTGQSGLVLAASRAAGPQMLAHTHRAGQRDFRIPRDLAQPAATAHLAWHAHTHRVRSSTPTTTSSSMNPVIRLHRTQGPPEPRPNPGRFTVTDPSAGGLCQSRLQAGDWRNLMVPAHGLHGTLGRWRQA